MNDDEQYESVKMLPKHAKMRVIATLIFLLFILIFIALMFLPWQQTVSGYGKAIALSPNDREQSIIAPISGRLGKWYVHDGSVVKKDELIVEIKDNDPNLLKRLTIEKKSTRLKLSAMKRALVTAQKNVARKRILYKEGISSQRDYEKATLEYNHYQDKLANTQIALTRINTQIARQKNQVVKAPRDGTIIKRLPGENSVLVKQGDKLAVLVPQTDSRIVQIWLNGNDAPLIRKNQSVRLQFEGWPAIQLSGWPSVAVGTFAGKVHSIDPIDNGEGMFRVLVTPVDRHDWPNSTFLQQGVRAHGWVLLSRVSLWFEIWRRFNSFPPLVDNAKPMKLFSEQRKKK